MKNIYFYILNPNDFQEFNSTIVELIRSSIECNIKIIILDITSKKRPLECYSEKELDDFYQNLKIKNENIFNSSVLTVKKFNFKDNDIAEFFELQEKFKPTLIFRRNYPNKNLMWLLPDLKSKTVLFLWEINECYQYRDDYLLAICRYPYMISNLKNTSIKVYENLRYPGEKHVFHISKNIIDFCKNNKTCFISETWARNQNEKETCIKELNFHLKIIKSKNIKISWKSREKYNKREKQYSLTESLQSNFDLIITKDINYPSSLMYLMANSDFCIVINTTSVLHDAIKLNRNTFHYIQSDYDKKYIKRLKDVHGKELHKIRNIQDVHNIDIKDLIINKLFLTSNSSRKLLDDLNFLLLGV